MRSGLRVWWNWQTRYFEVVVGQPVQVQVLLRAPIFLKQLRRDGTRRMVHAEVDLAFATEFLLHAMQGLLLPSTLDHLRLGPSEVLENAMRLSPRSRKTNCRRCK